MKTAFIGTGLLGYPMAEQLIKQQKDVVVFNRTRAKAVPLTKLGAQLASSASEAIDPAERVVLMLSDHSAIQAVLFDSGSNLSEKTVIQMGTISPGQSRAIAQKVDQSGGAYFEAPVLGSIPQARERSLFVLGGGAKVMYEQLEGLLKVFGNPRYIGEIGQAAALKLALNQLIASLTAAFSLSLAFVRESGVEVEQFMDILRNSALYAPTFDKKLPAMLEREFDNPNFPTKHLLKDVNLMLDAMGESGLNTAGLQGVQQVIAKAVAEGLAEKDYSSLYLAVERL